MHALDAMLLATCGCLYVVLDPLINLSIDFGTYGTHSDVLRGTVFSSATSSEERSTSGFGRSATSAQAPAARPKIKDSPRHRQ